MTETLEGLKKVLVELERRAQIMNNSKNPQVVEMQRIIYNEFNETLNFY